MSMEQTDQANARHHTYLLFSRFYLNGVTVDLLPYISQIPQLKEAGSTTFDRDKAAAAHSQVFAQNIAPYESVFLDTSGLLGGIHSEKVKLSYQRAGIRFNDGEDEIGHELAFIAALCRAESDRLEANDTPGAHYFNALQRRFLEEHLLRWLPPFVISLKFSGQPFYDALGQLTLALAYDHWTAETSSQPEHIEKEIGNNHKELSQLLNEENTNLSQIAQFLLTPPHSGIYLGQKTISELARRNLLPRGFGSRKQMLSNLFRSAAQYELVPNLLQDLQDHCHEWANLYRQQIELYPLLEAYIASWSELVVMTANALFSMKEQFQEMTHTSDYHLYQSQDSP